MRNIKSKRTFVIKNSNQYDRRTLTYSDTFNSRTTTYIIQLIEWLSGRLKILQLVKKFEQREFAPQGSDFWPAVLDTMDIEILTPADQIANIPKTGPLVVTANHPQGLIDGIVLASLIGKVREDYRILTRSVLTNIDATASSYLISVPFPHDEDVQKKMLEMRRKAMAHLKKGGVVIVFPAGEVMSSDSWFGPAIEREWSLFTAQLIRRSGAAILPIFCPGSNSRLYQIACRTSSILRQGLLLHEVKRTCGKPQCPVIGDVIKNESLERLEEDPKGFMAWLRKRTLALGLN